MGIRSILKKVGGYVSLIFGAVMLLGLIAGLYGGSEGIADNPIGIGFGGLFSILLLLLGIWWIRPQAIRKLGIARAFEDNKKKKGEKTGFNKMCPKCKGTNTTREWSIGYRPWTIGIFIFLFLPLAIILALVWRHYVCKKCGLKI